MRLLVTRRQKPPVLETGGFIVLHHVLVALLLVNSLLKWAHLDSYREPIGYELVALPIEL